MKLFRFFKNKENTTFHISKNDKIWVEENFKILIQIFGFPKRESGQIKLSVDYFPTTFRTEQVLIENIIHDLSELLQIKKEKISFEEITDFRDITGMPFVIQGKPFETDLEAEGGKYKIYIAKSLHKVPKRLIYLLTCESIKIKLLENEMQLDKSINTEKFVYLASIYFGFGVLLSQNLIDTGRMNDGLMERKWNYLAAMSIEIMAFSLAIYSNLIELENPIWQQDLPSDLKTQFEKAVKFLALNPIENFDKQEIEAFQLFKTAFKQSIQLEFEKAISILEKVLQLTNNPKLKSDVYNNLGYYNLRLKKYEQSVNYFLNSIQLNPNYGYANDNLGYVLILLGKLEDGKQYLEKAQLTKNNQIAYSYRNLALYHQAKGEMDKAEEFYQKSFASMTNSVDLLEYHYADFLIQNGKTNQGIEFLQKAVDKGEPEAIEKMNQIKKTDN